MRQQIKSTDVLKVCDAYNTTLEDFEKILALEDALFPLLLKRWEAKEKPVE